MVKEKLTLPESSVRRSGKKKDVSLKFLRTWTAAGGFLSGGLVLCGDEQAIVQHDRIGLR